MKYPRAYQTRVISETYAAMRAGKRRVMVQLATGGGKTPVAAWIARDAVAKRGRRGIFIAPRLTLVDQAAEQMIDAGLAPTVMKDGDVYGDTNAGFFVASAQTLRRIGAPRLGQGDLVFVDEAHRADTDEIVNWFPDAFIIGLSATPCRDNGMPLSTLYDEIVVGPTQDELADMGFLVRPLMFSAAVENDDDLARHFESPHVISGYIETLAKLPPARTVVFTRSIAHADDVTEKLNAAGVPAVSMHSELDWARRGEAMSAFMTRRVDVIVNPSMLVEGWNVPELERVVLLDALESLPGYLQRVGRGTRPWCHDCGAAVCSSPTGGHRKKAVFELWDFGGNVIRHGDPFMPRPWSLSRDVAMAAKKAISGAGVWRCRKCFCVARAAPKVCPHCGIKAEPRMVRMRAGRIVEWTKETTEQVEQRKREQALSAQNAKRHRHLVFLMIRAGYAPGRAGARAKQVLEAMARQDRPWETVLAEVKAALRSAATKTMNASVRF